MLYALTDRGTNRATYGMVCTNDLIFYALTSKYATTSWTVAKYGKADFWFHFNLKKRPLLLLSLSFLSSNIIQISILDHLIRVL